MIALFILFTTAIIVLFAGLTGRRDILQPLTLLGLIAAAATTSLDLFGGANPWNDRWETMFRFDGFSLGFTLAATVATALIVGLSGWGFRKLNFSLGDNYGLLLFSLCGALVLFSFTNMTMLFLGIEILSIPLYVLAGTQRDDLNSNEAALKYFLMGAFATGILLFGMTLVYGATGSFDIHSIHAATAAASGGQPMLKVGILLILVGMSFKISAAPFHFWAPDVYTGSPNLITAFMATVVKTAGFGAFFRLFSLAFPAAEGFWSIPLSAVAALTMTLANLTALFQTDFKRMMAYSSISHAGYLLLGILAFSEPGADNAMLFYLFTYSVATVCAFGAYIAVAEQTGEKGFPAFNGLGKKQPLLAAVMVISMLTLAGIPPTAGFFGKYFLFTAAFAKYPWLIVLAVVNSAISIYYYFKVIIAMYFSKEEHPDTIALPSGVRWVVWAGILLIALLTIAPGFLYRLVG